MPVLVLFVRNINMLTIAIPTYNRNQLLLRCLERLVPQLGFNHQLIIIDNCSEKSVSDYLDECSFDCNQKRIRIIRNAINIGGGGNLLRCLEYTESTWLYCLGDDDLVADDCIEKIEKAIKEYPKALYISFSREMAPRKFVTITQGLREFTSALDDWSSFLFMSSTIINAEKMRPAARWGYLYSYTWAPFQAILIKLLNTSGEVVFSNEVICVEESLSNDTWVPFPVAAGKMVLPELVDRKDLRAELAARLMSKPSSVALIYLARATSKDKNTLERNRFFVLLYLRRCAEFSNFGNCFKLILYNILVWVMLTPYLLPDKIFKYIEISAFKLINRKIPSSRPMSDDRT
jgi:glycosyltransferase involved in cell wall biosynthesis